MTSTKKKTRKPKIDAAWLDTHEWGLRSSNSGVAHGGFRWPRIGVWVKCPDWDDRAVCGGGFHYNAPGASGYGFDFSRLELIETRGPRIVIDGNKAKSPEARIVAVGAAIPREAFERCGFFVIEDGAKIEKIESGLHVLLIGSASVKTVSGGYVRSFGTSRMDVGTVSSGYAWSCGTSRMDVKTVSGGDVRSCDTSRMDVKTVSGGYVRSFGTSRMDVKTVSGGDVRSCDTSRMDVGTVSSGDAWSCGTSRMDVKTVSGGSVRSFGTSRMDVKTVSGGDVRSCDTSRMDVGTVSSGDVWSCGTSKMAIKKDKRKNP